jgi:hypothetical protein
VSEEQLLAGLDPGVRRLVAYLRALGHETTDSGDGQSKPEEDRALDGPHVFIRVEPERIVARANALKLDVERLGYCVEPGTIQASYDPADGCAVIALLGVSDRVFG